MAGTIDDLAELREEADVIQQQLEATEARQRPTSATDESGTITVTLDEAGAVSNIRVDRGWRNAMAPDELPAGVLDALTAAGMQRLERWTEDLDDVEKSESFRPRPPQADKFLSGLVRAVERHEAGTEELLALTSDMVSELLEGIEKAEQLLDEHATHEYVGLSRRRHVRATITGNSTVTALWIDSKWLRNAHEINLGHEITTAITAGLEKARAGGLTAIMKNSGLARVTELMNNPRAIHEGIRRG